MLALSRRDGENRGVEPSPIRYAKSADVNIAYQVTGEGPFDLVLVHGFFSLISKSTGSIPRPSALRRDAPRALAFWGR